jgi:hypothetical protein
MCFGPFGKALNDTTYFFEMLDGPVPNIFTLVLWSLPPTSQYRRMGKAGGSGARARTKHERAASREVGKEGRRRLPNMQNTLLDD